MAQAVDEACVHGVVHFVGHAEPVPFFPKLCCGRGAVAFHVVECVLSRECLGRVNCLYGGEGVFLYVAEGAAYGLQTAVGARGGDVELEHEGHSADGAYEGGVDAPPQSAAGVGGVGGAARGE